MKNMVRQAVPLQPMEVNSGADLDLQPMDCIPEQVGVPEGGCDSMGNTRWSRLLAGPVDLWRERTSHWSWFAGRTCDPMGDPHWSSLFLKEYSQWKGSTLEQFMKNCSLWEGLTLDKFMEDCLLWEGPHNGAEEECEEEGVVETMCDELTSNPVPHPRWGVGREFGSNVEPKKKGGVGGSCF